MSEQSEGSRDEVAERAQAIYERLLREHRIDFQNIRPAAPVPTADAPGRGAPAPAEPS